MIGACYVFVTLLNIPENLEPLLTESQNYEKVLLSALPFQEVTGPKV